MTPAADLYARLREVFLESETVAVRFFLGMMALGYAIYMPATTYHQHYALANQWIHPAIWSVFFLLHGSALMYGVITQRYSLFLMIVEGFLGAFVWLVLGIATSVAQGVPGPTLAAALVAGWVLVRYPSWK